ncbi:hypothetical protein [Actinoalloteichus hymeniacidonis]|uniref:Uncharacterized protein n=1 Tax=Actinoalloteichus hymeniacidonis TaxID=340345 RepID=A0AAC9HUX5_9PSEU|nr:hypothetical protein [Actinoalloteichus hymeniacidonis]AOS65873.1 hypothetical protein TL08_25485 [Actinoalloteichus hymeniacidonis]MBB5906033.1 hypothetical protein [Actinoalloteichus hymeniacidonis]
MNPADRSLLSRIAALLDVLDPPPPELSLRATESVAAGMAWATDVPHPPADPTRPQPGDSNRPER